MKPTTCLLVIGSAFVVACGGGSKVAGIDGGGNPAPVVTDITSHGRITGFGSVIVNGVRYDTSGATITIDGNPGIESDLAVGQIVLVQGTLNSDRVTGTADSVDFDDAVEGPIESIDLGADSMVVLGQTVLVDANTSFEDDIDPASLEGLSAGQIVEVSGNLDADGNTVAAYIDLKDPGNEFEVTGFVTSVDAGAMTLTIKGLVVDYGDVLVLDDFPNGEPEIGQLVEAKGTEFGPAGELMATELEFKGNDLNLADGDDVEIEGFITRFASATDFDVSGVPVTTTGSTVYENGVSADLALNRKVEVEGEFDGILVAQKIEFKQDGTIRIGAPVEGVQADGLTLLGIAVRVPMSAEFDDQRDPREPNFDLGDVRVGNYVEIRSFFDDTGTLTATRLERDEDPGEVSLRGFVETANLPVFTILGVTIRTDASTDFEDNDVPIDAMDFFSRAEGRLVEAKGTLQNGEILADEVEFKNDE